jgi:hypothetical protein
MPTGPINLPTSDIILEQPLSEYTRNQLFSIRFADSCTIDPHKAGFAPYPAGSLCYRDERLRFMVTITAAYINTTADVDSIGTYGVEGRFVYIFYRVWNGLPFRLVNQEPLLLLSGWHTMSLVSITRAMVHCLERQCIRLLR